MSTSEVYKWKGVIRLHIMIFVAEPSASPTACGSHVGSHQGVEFEEGRGGVEALGQ